jgi:hypothetical protein
MSWAVHFSIAIDDPAIKVVLDSYSSLWMAFWGIAALGRVVDGPFCNSKRQFYKIG